MTLARRIKDRRKSLQMSQADLAQAAQVSQQLIGKIELGDVKDSRKIFDLAKALGVNVEWLRTGQGHELNRDDPSPQIPGYKIRAVDTDTVDEDQDALIDVVDVELSAGGGKVVPEFRPTKRQLAYSREWLLKRHLKPKNLVIMPVHGDSMLPTLSSGDVVLIDTTDTKIIDGKIYALVLGREAKIKRLRWDARGALIIMSDSSDKSIYPDEAIPLAEVDDIHIIGRALQRSGDL